jgi:hypothetical protein
MLEAGELTLTSLSLLAPHLSDENHRDVLSRARYRSKREVEEITVPLEHQTPRSTRGGSAGIESHITRGSSPTPH